MSNAGILKQIKESDNLIFLFSVASSNVSDAEILNAVLEKIDPITESPQLSMLKQVSGVENSEIENKREYNSHLIAQIVSNPNCTAEIMDKAIDKCEKHQAYFDVLYKISTDEKVQPETIEKIEKKVTNEELREYINSKIEKEPELNNIDGNTNEEEKMKEIVNNAEDRKVDMLNDIIKSYDNKSVIREDMRRTNGPILKYVSTKEELEQIVKENTPKESTLIEKAEGLNELSNVDKYLEILDEPECTEEHIDTILEKVNISEVLTENDKAEIYITIVDNENASSEILEKITNSTDNDVVMLGVINNDNCDIETIENILNKTDDAFVESIAINKIDELIDSDMEIMSNEIIDFENAIDDSIKDIENLDYIDNDTDNVEPETDDIEYDNDNDIDVSERD